MTVILLLLLSLPAMGQTPSASENVIDVKDIQQCGLVTRFPGDILSPNCFQTSNNILTDRTGVLTRRGGYAQYNGTACPGSQAIRGMWPFYAQDGTRYLVMHSSNSMFYSPGDGTCNYIAGLQSAISANVTMECVQALGQLWCTDGVDTPFSTNVTSTQAISQAPIGYHIGTFRNRILFSGVPGTGANGSGSEVFLSGELNGADYTIPAIQLTTSPAIISVNGINDGEIVTCLMGEFQNQFLIGRGYDLWGLSGYNLSDFALRQISDQVGCLEPRSVQEVTNVKYWLSNRGIEGYTGTQINRVSYPIDSQIIPIIAAAGNLRTQTLTTQSDWQSGNLTASGPGAAISATIAPGSITPSTWSVLESTTQFVQGTLSPLLSTSAVPGGLEISSSAVIIFNGDFEQGACAAGIYWTCTSNGSAACQFDASGSIGGSCGAIVKTNVSGTNLDTSVSILNGSNQAVLYSETLTQNPLIGTPGTTIDLSALGLSTQTLQIKFSAFADGNSATLISSTFTAISTISWSGTQAFGSQGWSKLDNIRVNRYFSIYNSSAVATYFSQIYDTGISTTVGGQLLVSSSTPSGSSILHQIRSAATSAGVGSAAWSSITDQANSAQTGRFQQFMSSFTTQSGTSTAIMYSWFLSNATTGYYITPCIQVSSPTSYGGLLVNGATGGGGLSFWISTGATCGNAVSAATATWNSQPANSIISVTTVTTYIAARVLFSLTSGTQTPTINDITFSWNNGASRPPTASVGWDDRYLLFYTTSTSAGAVNDHAFVYDQNQKWQLWDDEYAASAALFKNTLYTGDSNATGLIYQQDSGQSDNGGAFNMVFQTADFDGGDPNMNKKFSRAYIVLGAPSSGNSSASLSCNYSIDGSSLTFSLGTVTLSESTNSNGYFVAPFKFPSSNPVVAHWLNLTCSYLGSVGPVAVHRIRLVYKNKSWD